MNFKHDELVDFYTWKDKERLDVNKHNGKIVRSAPYLVVLDLDTNKKYKFDYIGNSLKDGEQRMVYKVGEYFVRLTTSPKIDSQGFSYWTWNDITLPEIDYSLVGNTVVVDTHNNTYSGEFIVENNLFGVQPTRDMTTLGPLTPEMVEEAADTAIRHFFGRNNT